MAELDPRLMVVEIQTPNETRTYGNDADSSSDRLNVAIAARGVKFTNANQGECSIDITNLEKSQRDFLLTEGRPRPTIVSQLETTIRLRVGRVSTGLSLLYEGGLFRTKVTQIPDQTITLSCLTKQFQKGNMVSLSFSGVVSLETIARQVAIEIEADREPVFEATDQMIADFSFTGSATRLVDKLNDVQGVEAFVDDNQLVVLDAVRVRRNSDRILTPETGMIGIPQPTEQGIKATMLFDSQTRTGGMLDVRSARYPVYSGIYKIYKLSYHVTNREIPFYLIAEARVFTNA